MKQAFKYGEETEIFTFRKFTWTLAGEKAVDRHVSCKLIFLKRNSKFTGLQSS